MRLPTPLLRRSPDAHKGVFGHILILAGSLRLSGAAVLCAGAAMRAGAGLVTLGIPESLARPLIKVKPQEVMLLPLPETGDGTLGAGGYARIKGFARDADILVVGPGLTRNRSTQALARKVITGIDKPMVIDADGLNALAGHLEILCLPVGRKSLNAKILTPHPGEMARLLGIGVKKVQADRKGVADKFARGNKVTVVLKGHDTVVADYNGNMFINKTGNPGMATAGSGDVLSGMIAAFIGQGLGAFEASKYAVYLHGLAGDLAVAEKTAVGMVASDIIERIPEAVKKSS
ncbi:MAG: NAD(P)H-hydrate dehydratase [Candidatus Omnitrophota bacterium]